MAELTKEEQAAMAKLMAAMMNKQQGKTINFSELDLAFDALEKSMEKRSNMSEQDKFIMKGKIALMKKSLKNQK